MRDAEVEAGLDPHDIGDPYAPYITSRVESGEVSPYAGEFNNSSQALPLVAHASPFQRAEMYDNDEYDENRSLRSEDFDGRSRVTSRERDMDAMSGYGSESYAPSRNMFQTSGGDKKGGRLGGIMDKEAQLAGEIQEGETTEVLRESSARRKWVALCWMLTFWVPTPFLTWFGRMKRMDVRQA